MAYKFNFLILVLIFGFQLDATELCYVTDNVLTEIDNESVLNAKENLPDGTIQWAWIRGTMLRQTNPTDRHYKFAVQIGPLETDTVELVYNKRFGTLPLPAAGDIVEACGEMIVNRDGTLRYNGSPEGVLIHKLHEGSVYNGFVRLDPEATQFKMLNGTWEDGPNTAPISYGFQFFDVEPAEFWSQRDPEEVLPNMYRNRCFGVFPKEKSKELRKTLVFYKWEEEQSWLAMRATGKIVGQLLDHMNRLREICEPSQPKYESLELLKESSLFHDDHVSIFKNPCWRKPGTPFNKKAEYFLLSMNEVLHGKFIDFQGSAKDLMIDLQLTCSQ